MKPAQYLANEGVRASVSGGQMRFCRLPVSGVALLTLLVVLILGTGAAHALEPPPVKRLPTLLFDLDDGLVLYAEEPDLRWYPASLTKLMTAYLTFEAVENSPLLMDERVSCSGRASRQVPTKIGLPAGAHISVRRALEALIVKSANDMAVVLAEGVGMRLAKLDKAGRCRISETPYALARRARSGLSPSPHAPDTLAEPLHPVSLGRIPHDLDDEREAITRRTHEFCAYDAFIARMNHTARRLGMARTRFVNPNGLPNSRQMTTARDMGLLARALWRDYPQYADLFAKTFTRIGGRRLTSYNSLLTSFDGANGMKTGFICAAGYNIVASANRDGKKLIAVVMGLPSSGQRNIRVRKLLSYGYKVHPWKRRYASMRLDEMPLIPNGIRGPVDIRRKVRSRVCRW